MDKGLDGLQCFGDENGDDDDDDNEDDEDDDNEDGYDDEYSDLESAVPNVIFWRPDIPDSGSRFFRDPGKIPYPGKSGPPKKMIL